MAKAAKPKGEPVATGKGKSAATTGEKAKGSVFDSAIKTHAGDETTYQGGGDLPAGINDGVAQLVECKFDKFKKGDNKGELYFYAAGVVVEPKEFNGMRLEGLRTSIMEPVCDTPNRSRETVDEHIAWVLNELRKLGVDTTELESQKDVEAAMAALVEEQPFFRFRTWIGTPSEQFPNPRVQHDWRGVTEYEGEPEAELEDKTAKPKKAKKAEEPVEEEEEVDLESLAELADGDDEDAQVKLTEMAEDAGIDTEKYDSWASVAEAIAEAEGSGGDADEEPESDWKPEEGATVNAEIDGKIKKCTVQSVNEKKQTAKVQTVLGKKVHEVSFDLLQPIE